MSSSQPSPQFEKADFGQQPQGDVCFKCNQSIVGSYYRTNGAMTCASCANILQHDAQAQPGGNFMRSLLFGSAGALLGLIIYSAVGIMTGLVIGYVSLAVGFIIAKAMLKGSGGIGGRKYQIAAVLLTYMAVSMSAVPIALHAMSQNQSQSAKATSSSDKSNASTGQSEGQWSPETKESKQPEMGFLGAIALLAGIGLASPFMGLGEGISGVIGLVILFVGMNIAWKMTAGTGKPAIEGPYTV